MMDVKIVSKLNLLIVLILLSIVIGIGVLYNINAAPAQKTGSDCSNTDKGKVQCTYTCSTDEHGYTDFEMVINNQSSCAASRSESRSKPEGGDVDYQCTLTREVWC